MAQGDLPEALKAYRDSRAIIERLAKADPGNAAWQRDLSVSYNKVGDVLKAQGNLAEALKAYRDGLAIGERLAKADPGNAGWQRDLSVPIKGGRCARGPGRPARGLKAYRDGLAIASASPRPIPATPDGKPTWPLAMGSSGRFMFAWAKRSRRGMFERGRAIVAPFAEKSGHQSWICVSKGSTRNWRRWRSECELRTSTKNWYY